MAKIYQNPRQQARETELRKADNMREVEVLPNFARNGDQVYFKRTAYVYLSGEWKPIGGVGILEDPEGFGVDLRGRPYSTVVGDSE